LGRKSANHVSFFLRIIYEKGKETMYKELLLIALVSAVFSGCASIPMESTENSDMAKKFNPPSDGNAGLYIYRSGAFGGALKKDVWVDGNCIGETAPNIFFYEEVLGDKEHIISTESEFSPNELLVTTVNGQNYFVRQYIKMGVFVGGAGVEITEEEEGKETVKKLKMAKKGTCSKMSEPAKAEPTQEGDDAKPAVKTVREGSDQLADGRYVLILSKAIGNSNCMSPFPEGKQQAFSVENSAVKQGPSPFIRVRSRDIRIYGEEFSATFVGPYILQGRPAMRFKGRRIDNGFQGTYIAPVASDACMGDFQLLRVAQ
jgi:hypothetical protein